MSVPLFLTYNFLYPHFRAISFFTSNAVPVYIITTPDASIVTSLTFV